MPKRQVFYSFDYDNDVFRVQQVRNMGAIEDDTIVSPNAWETIKTNDRATIRKWIDDNMKNRSCIIVLIGSETAKSFWVKYEIRKAYKERKGLFGIYIHNLKCPRNGKSQKGDNPFVPMIDDYGKSFSLTFKTYTPDPADALGDIRNNIETWIEKALSQKY